MTDGLYTAEVLRTRYVTPLMVRVTLGGPGLYGFAGSGVPDEYFKMFFPAPGRTAPTMPDVVDGRWVYPPGEPEPELRTYTVRRYDAAAGELDVDFVVHEGGVAGPWAVAARPGDRVGLAAPHGVYRPPADTGLRLLLADATALPAVGRIIEELPEGARATAYVEVAGPAEHQEFETAGEVEVTWIHPGDGTGLEQVLRAHDLDATTYVWAAGEAGVMRAIRRHLRHERGLPAERYATLGYWRPAAEEWQRRFSRVADDVRAKVAEARSSGKDSEECQDEFDAALEAAGL
ncbi:siderophore-interacting protein [Streptosporangium saharense]|uniref:NADPH-dependent ferric siderophore reductase n=1 Tax=Streptosporangium saharense TaxID=1706840 RepID=A0A7W7QH55_9ACTN|nr:siderophore-interacting protein [Streptosporangium saharense]MBB4913547.1 NADPH-dependent ferric siderophore reductase [Streptosporangium saharense]